VIFQMIGGHGVPEQMVSQLMQVKQRVVAGTKAPALARASSWSASDDYLSSSIVPPAHFCGSSDACRAIVASSSFRFSDRRRLPAPLKTAYANAAPRSTTPATHMANCQKPLA
jgi:hypothetical protein